MRKPSWPSNEPFSPREPTSAGNAPRGLGSFRFGAPVPEPPTRGGEPSGEPAAPAGSHGFRSAILRERSGASERSVPTGPADASSLRPGPTPGARPSDEDSRWLQTWQANEIRWLNDKVEELEQQLRRRTIVSVGAVALGGLAVVAAVAFSIVSPRLPEAVVAEIVTTSPDKTPVAAGLRAGQPGMAPETVPSQAGSTPTSEEPAVAVPARPQASQNEPYSEITPSAMERAPADATSAAGESGPGSQRQISPITPAADGTAPAAQASGQAAEAWRLEAEQALMAIIERVSTSGPPGEPEQATETPAPPIPAATPRDGTGADELPADAGESVGGLESEGPISPEAGAVGDTYAATAFVNLRDGPGIEAEAITVVEAGDRVRRLGSLGDWLLIEYQDTQIGMVTGWVHGRFLRRVEGPSQGNGSFARSDG